MKNIFILIIFIAKTVNGNYFENYSLTLERYINKFEIHTDNNNLFVHTDDSNLLIYKTENNNWQLVNTINNVDSFTIVEEGESLHLLVLNQDKELILYGKIDEQFYALLKHDSSNTLNYSLHHHNNLIMCTLNDDNKLYIHKYNNSIWQLEETIENNDSDIVIYSLKMDHKISILTLLLSNDRQITYENKDGIWKEVLNINTMNYVGVLSISQNKRTICTETNYQEDIFLSLYEKKENNWQEKPSIIQNTIQRSLIAEDRVVLALQDNKDLAIFEKGPEGWLPNPQIISNVDRIAISKDGALIACIINQRPLIFCKQENWQPLYQHYEQMYNIEEIKLANNNLIVYQFDVANQMHILKTFTPKRVTKSSQSSTLSKRGLPQNKKNPPKRKKI